MSTKNLTRAEIEVIRASAPYVLFVPYWISQSLSSKGIPVEQITNIKPGNQVSEALTVGDYAVLNVFNGSRWTDSDDNTELGKFNKFFGNINKFTTLSDFSDKVTTPFDLVSNTVTALYGHSDQSPETPIDPKIKQAANIPAYSSAKQLENVKTLLDSSEAPPNLKSYEFLTGIDGRAVICIMGPTFYKATLVSAENIAFSVACLGELYKKLTNKEFLAHYGLFKNLI